MTEVEATDIAKSVFEGTRYKPTEQDIANLSKNLLLLEKSGLNKLNKRLMEGGKKYGTLLLNIIWLQSLSYSTVDQYRLLMNQRK